MSRAGRRGVVTALLVALVAVPGPTLAAGGGSGPTGPPGPVDASVDTTQDGPSDSRGTRPPLAEPIAVATAPDGVTYVGFASGRALVRLNPAGFAARSIPLDRPGPVTGLAVGRRKTVWVDYGDWVSRLDRRGRVLQSWAHRPGLACSAADSDPARYGGIAVHGTTVYVAERCRGTVGVYRQDGLLRATLDLPGSTPGRGLTWLGAQGRQPDRLVVAVPDQHRLVVYDADRLVDDIEPREVLVLSRPRKGKAPVPAGIVADRFGQVVVSDLANHALYFLDAGNRFARYRTLGYPPRAGRRAGALSSPSALAQHPQDGSRRAGQLLIADTANRRVQRWGADGYTYWSRDSRAPRGREPSASPRSACERRTAVRLAPATRVLRTPQVVLGVTAPEDATAVQVSNDADFTVERTFELAEDCRYEWRLEPGVGARTVWLRFPGSGDTTVRTVRTQLDGASPRVDSARARWSNALRTWVLSVRAQDRGSGLATLQYAASRDARIRSVGFRRSVTNRDGRQLRWVRVIDRAGIASHWRRVRGPLP